MNQIRKDINRRVAERLSLWLSDSIDLYDMAGIRDAGVYGWLVYTLLTALAAALVKADISKGEACRMLIQVMDKTQQDKQAMEDGDA